MLNNPTETAAMQNGMRTRIEGRVEFQDLSFTYPGSKLPALDKVTVDIPAGTMLGVVGRSGSGQEHADPSAAGDQPPSIRGS